MWNAKLRRSALFIEPSYKQGPILWSPGHEQDAILT